MTTKQHGVFCQTLIMIQRIREKFEHDRYSLSELEEHAILNVQLEFMEENIQEHLSKVGVNKSTISYIGLFTRLLEFVSKLENCRTELKYKKISYEILDKLAKEIIDMQRKEILHLRKMVEEMIASEPSLFTIFNKHINNKEVAEIINFWKEYEKKCEKLKETPLPIWLSSDIFCSN